LELRVLPSRAILNNVAIAWNEKIYIKFFRMSSSIIRTVGFLLQTGKLRYSVEEQLISLNGQAT
jgi:mRNA degradation ribonuclease J1/J2